MPWLSTCLFTLDSGYVTVQHRAPIGYDCMLNSVSVYCGSVSGNFDSCESTTWISTRTQEFRTKKQVANYWSWLCFDLKYNFEWILTFSRSSSFIFLVAKDNDLATHTELMRIGLCFIFLNLLPDKFRSKDDFVQKHKNVSSFNEEEFRHELSTIWLTAAKVYISRLSEGDFIVDLQLREQYSVFHSLGRALTKERLSFDPALRVLHQMYQQWDGGAAQTYPKSKDLYASGGKHWNDSAEELYQNSKLALSRLRDSN
ncbi:UNVERIFIED_CONTAM: hypothetical protein Scaly_2530800 [Sesamum calycinum]|uniref:Uncharacterized protein n=1 Tax=Sesamum calycinum TaxID=2727403 RepID=A0AAW2LV50_9LAMI